MAAELLRQLLRRDIYRMTAEYINCDEVAVDLDNVEGLDPYSDWQPLVPGYSSRLSSPGIT